MRVWKGKKNKKHIRFIEKIKKKLIKNFSQKIYFSRKNKNKQNKTNHLK